MSEINAFWACAGCFVGYFLGGISFCLHASRRGWFKEKPGSNEPNLLRVTVHSVDETTPEMRERRKEIDEERSDFAVTGKPLKPSWRIRKRELEAASRTKRKQLESFREIA